MRQNTKSTMRQEEVRHDPAASRSVRLNFSDPAQRTQHIQAFLAWLPSVLHDAPGINWDRLPSSVMAYFVRTVGDSPDAIPIALAIGCAMDGMRNYSLLMYSRGLNQILRKLRSQYGLQDLAQLNTRAIWDLFVAERTLPRGEFNQLSIYAALSSIHLRAYLEGLSVRERTRWEQYALPPLPTSFLEKHGIPQAAYAGSEQRRKERSDVLVPLFPLLVEIAQLRKQAAERLIKVFRAYRDRAISGEITLPFHFQYTDRIFSVSENAPTLSEVSLVEREVTLSFTLWDRASWVKDHAEHFKRRTFLRARGQKFAYAYPLYFLQFHGSPDDLLWCGDLIANRMLGKSSGRDDYTIYRPGLLTPTRADSVWLDRVWDHATASGEHVILFEPESLYRAILYATALATVALTNGSRLNELLQVSAARFETIVVDELKDQQPTGRKIGILVQNLLPKGSTQESQRQFFLIGEVAGRLLAEIGQLLETTHGGSIPVVHPYQNSKAEDLRPEPYLFQWEASRDGRLGLVRSPDVGVLLRFLYYRLTLTTKGGEPIRVAAHLLRHVRATHARTVQNVPAEAVAYLLHHRVKLSDSTRALSIPEATAYYSRLPLERLLALLFEAQSILISKNQVRSYLEVPTPRTLEEMDAALRRIFEQWGLIGPTVLGYCSAGLCVRPNNRALCLGCPFLVPHYSNLRSAETWRKLYVLQIELHDAHGHYVDAQQARQMLQYLDDIIRVMEIQIRVRQDGGYLPFGNVLPPDNEKENDA
jgi:hypothetical protein